MENSKLTQRVEVSNKESNKAGDRTIRLFARVTDSDGKVYELLQRKLPFLIPDGRKHMLRLRRERQLARGNQEGAA